MTYNLKVPTEEEETAASALLSSLGLLPNQNREKHTGVDSFKTYTAEKNKSLIKKIDTRLTDTIEDSSQFITMKDLIAMKAEMFKEIQVAEGNEQALDTTRLIPTNITLNIQNNY